MQIYILRHGEAAFSLQSDFHRALTPEGQSQVKHAATQAPELAMVDCLLVSPLVRAQQTAHLLLDAIGQKPAKTVDWLTPETDVSIAIEQLALVSNDNNLLLVSHLPLVAELTDTLCAHQRGFSRFATASLARIDADVVASGCGHLRWMKHVK